MKTARDKINTVNQCVMPSSKTSHSVDRTLSLELLKVNLFPELESIFLDSCESSFEVSVHICVVLQRICALK